MKTPVVYIITNTTHGTLYIGVTSDLPRRIQQHKEKQAGSFSTKYNLDKLVYFELINDMYNAIAREKQLKNWRRKWKIQLIERDNPNWRDLSMDL